MHPDIAVTALDLPGVLEATQLAVSAAGFSDRFGREVSSDRLEGEGSIHLVRPRRRS